MANRAMIPAMRAMPSVSKPSGITMSAASGSNIGTKSTSNYMGLGSKAGGLIGRKTGGSSFSNGMMASQKLNHGISQKSYSRMPQVNMMLGNQNLFNQKNA